MRILAVSNYYPPHYKGAYEILCEATVNELVSRGHRMYVLTGNWGVNGGEAPGRPKEDNVYRALHLHSFRDLTRVRRTSAQLAKACMSRLDRRVTQRIVAAVKPDLIYAWNLGDLSMSVLEALHQSGATMVFDLHDYWLLQWHRDLVQEHNRLKKVYRSSVEGCAEFERIERRHLIAISDALKQRYLNSGFPDENITVIRRGVPAGDIQDRPHPRNGSRPGLQLLFAGRLVQEKGVQVALQALALLARECPEEIVHLDVAGSGDYEGELKALAASLGLSGSVHFLGMIEHGKLAGSYWEYDAVLVPSVWVDPLPRAVMEPMARGVCVIASDLGGSREMITHDRDGLIVPANDCNALAQAILRLARTPRLSEELGKAAIERIRRDFVFEKSVDQIEDYLGIAVEAGKMGCLSASLSRCI